MRSEGGLQTPFIFREGAGRPESRPEKCGVPADLDRLKAPRLRVREPQLEKGGARLG